MRKQCGRNKEYPEQIETWKLGETIPEWLSDCSKILFVDGLGNLTLDISETSTGGYEIKTASGNDTLVRVQEKSGFVCYGDYKIFSLSQIQMSLLYSEEEVKKK